MHNVYIGPEDNFCSTKMSKDSVLAKWAQIPLNLTSESLKCWVGTANLAAGVREGQNMAQNGPLLWLWCPLETPKWVKDLGNGLKSIRGSWGNHFGPIWGPLDGSKTRFRPFWGRF